MSLASDKTFYAVLVSLLTLAFVATVLGLLARGLRRARPELNISLPVGTAVAVRVLAAIAVSLTDVAGTLRGGDELKFMADARDLVEESALSSDNLAALTGQLHTWIFGFQLRLLDSPDVALRIMQAGIAVAGLMLLAAAVHDLAGPWASHIAAWFIALEPASVFFSTLLHKEANMLLASGLIVFGGVRLWQRADLGALIPMGAGCLIAIATRPYVGWFLITAAALITMHSAARKPQLSSLLPFATGILVAAVFVIPFAFESTTDESLELNLQGSQDANASDSSNLALERVDYSTREDLVLNLPQRMRDVLTRPYPWQLANVEQQLGLLGTIVVLATLWALLTNYLQTRGTIMARAGPLVYVGFMSLFAYSLSSGNAGTAFRYRMHIVALALCALVVLREARLKRGSGGATLGSARGAPAPSGTRHRSAGPVSPDTLVNNAIIVPGTLTDQRVLRFEVPSASTGVRYRWRSIARCRCGQTCAPLSAGP